MRRIQFMVIAAICFIAALTAWLVADLSGDRRADTPNQAVGAVDVRRSFSAPSAARPQAGRVEGMVEGSGNGVARARVVLRLMTAGAAASRTLDVESAADGRFAFDAVPPGELYLSARLGEESSLVVGPLWMEDGGHLRGVRLTLGSSSVVEGLVVDLLRRQPIAGAQVVTAVARQRTGPTGSFQLRGARGPTWVEVSAPGYLARSEWVSLVEGRPGGRVELVLTPAAKVLGTVLEAGQPVPGASVWVELIAGSRSGERSALATTDVAGRFELDCGDGLLRPFAATPSGAQLRGRDFRLGIGERREGVLLEGGEASAQSGVVTRAGAPLAGAGLGFVEVGSERLVFASSSGAAGEFTVPALPLGKYLVRVSAGIYIGLAGPFAHDGAGAPWRVEVAPGASLRGRVRPAAAGVRVRWRSGEWAGPLAETATDTAGRFGFEGVPPGAVALDAEGPAGSGTTRARAGDDEVIIDLSRRGVAVEVRDEQGGPVSDATLVARSLDTGAVRRQLAVAPDGRFELDLPPGAWELFADVSGRGRSRSERFVVGTPGLAVTLVLPGAVQVRGTVRDVATGLPITGAMVMAQDRFDATPYRTAVVTSAQGQFQLPSVSAKSFVLVSKEGFVPASREISSADSASRLDFELSRGRGNHAAVDDSAWQFEGVGMVLSADGPRVVVAGVNEGSPAERGGVLKGDVVVTINGEGVAGPLGAVVSKIRGPSGSSVRIGFERRGQALEVVLRRRTLNF